MFDFLKNKVGNIIAVFRDMGFNIGIE